MKQRILAQIPDSHPWRSLVQYLEETDSTNDRVKALAKTGAPHGTAVIAGQQTAGKGRLGRSFHSPGGMGLYMSVLLRFPCLPDQLMHLTCAAAVAACDGVEKATGLRPGIKWTNDLVSDGKKLGGILTELVSAPDGTCAIIGIGINCGQAQEDFPPDIRDMACSLAMCGAADPSPASVAAALLEALEKVSWELTTGKKPILEQYKKDCITLGKEICILQDGAAVHARAVNIGEDGALVAKYADGQTRSIRFGEVSIRGMYGYV